MDRHSTSLLVKSWGKRDQQVLSGPRRGHVTLASILNRRTTNVVHGIGRCATGQGYGAKLEALDALHRTQPYSGLGSAGIFSAWFQLVRGDIRRCQCCADRWLVRCHADLVGLKTTLVSEQLDPSDDGVGLGFLSRAFLDRRLGTTEDRVVARGRCDSAIQIVDLHGLENPSRKLPDLLARTIVDFKPARATPNFNSGPAQRDLGTIDPLVSITDGAQRVRSILIDRADGTDQPQGFE